MKYVHCVVLSAISVLLFSSGCSVLPRETSEKTHFYILHSIEKPPSGEGGGKQGMTPAVAVAPVIISAYLKRPHIVTHEGGNEVHLSDFARWAEDLEEGIARVLAENLSVLLGRDLVRLDMPGGTQKAPFALEVRIIRFDGRLGGSVLLSAKWSLTEKSAGEVLISKKSLVHRAVSGAGYGPLVVAENGALEELSREIALAIGGIIGQTGADDIP